MTPSERILSANALYANGQFEKALVNYRAEIDSNPGSLLAHDGAARCLANLNKLEEAILICQTMLEMDASYAPAHVILAEIYRAMGEPAKGYAEIELAYSMAPANAEVLTSFGSMLLLDKKMDQAKPLFEEAININPNMYIALNNLLLIYVAKHDRSNILVCAKKMHLLRPSLKNFLRLIFAYMDYAWISPLLIVGLSLALVISELLHAWTVFILAGLAFLLFFTLRLYLKK